MNFHSTGARRTTHEAAFIGCHRCDGGEGAAWAQSSTATGVGVARSTSRSQAISGQGGTGVGVGGNPDSSMVANLRHHAADRVGVRCLQKTSVLCGKFFPPRGGGLPPYGQSFDGVGGMTFIWASIRTSWRSIDCRGRARRNGCKENEPTRCCGQDVDCIRGFRGRW